MNLWECNLTVSWNSLLLVSVENKYCSGIVSTIYLFTSKYRFLSKERISCYSTFFSSYLNSCEEEPLNLTPDHFQCTFSAALGSSKGTYIPTLLITQMTVFLDYRQPVGNFTILSQIALDSMWLKSFLSPQHDPFSVFPFSVNGTTIYQVIQVRNLKLFLFNHI